MMEEYLTFFGNMFVFIICICVIICFVSFTVFVIVSLWRYILG